MKLIEMRIVNDIGNDIAVITKLNQINEWFAIPLISKFAYHLGY